MSIELDNTKNPTSNAKPASKNNKKAWVANGLFVIYTHIVGAIMLIIYRPPMWTLLLTFFIWLLAGVGITMGYHRLWSHRTYEAAWPLRLILAIFGTMGFQGSIKWWSERHRLHHRFTDSENDPYDATKGFWFSHMGWIFQKPYYPKLPIIDVSDLLRDPIVRFQHKHYVPVALTVGFVLPAVLAWFWNDIWGGLLYAGHVSKILVWHTTFCINSFAHWIGSQDYSLEYTARGNLLLALLTNGEGHHNFHHQFPNDYRNGIRWYHYDPTKWLIKICEYVGLAKSLRKASNIDIKKALIVTAEERINRAKKELHWGPDIMSLPKMTLKEVEERALEGKALIVIDREVYDLNSYLNTHPGGTKVLKAYFGKDGTSAFNGGLNAHTQAARIRAKTLIVARIAD